MFIKNWIWHDDFRHRKVSSHNIYKIILIKELTKIFHVSFSMQHIRYISIISTLKNDSLVKSVSESAGIIITILINQQNGFKFELIFWSRKRLSQCNIYTYIYIYIHYKIMQIFRLDKFAWLKTRWIWIVSLISIPDVNADHFYVECIYVMLCYIYTCCIC